MSLETSMNPSVHLSDDALDDLLLDAGTPGDAAHLASCKVCAARLEMFQSSISLFNQASSAWSQAKANSVSRELPRRSPGFTILPSWSVAAAFFLAVALSFLVGIHRGMTPREEARLNTVQSANDDRQHEIASDNEMLNAIDTAISQPVSSPVQIDGIKRTSASSSRVGPSEVRN